MTTAEFNRVMRAMGRAALESEEALAVVYERAWLAAGRFYASQFSGEAVTASADWVPPAGAPAFDTSAAMATLDRQRLDAADAIQREFSRAAQNDLAISFDARSFRLFSPDLMTSIGQHAGANFDAAATDELQRVIRGSFDSGLTVPQTAKEIRRSFGEVSKSRATMLARTDLISLANGGSYMAARKVFKDKPLTQKVWLNAHDGRVRPSHAAAGGQAVPMDAPFSVGGFPLLYPGDPQGPPGEVINCRCTYTVQDAPPETHSEPEQSVARERSDALVEQTRAQTGAPTMPSSFTTVKEALEWAGQQGLAKEASLGTLKFADVKEVLEGLATVAPYIKRPLGSIEVGPSGSRTAASYRYHPGPGGAPRPDDRIVIQRAMANQSTIHKTAAREREKFEIVNDKTKQLNTLRLADPGRPEPLYAVARQNLERAQETKQWTLYEYSDRPTFTLMAHEAAHFLYFDDSLAYIWGVALKKRGLLERAEGKHWRVSEYGSTNRSELFAEVFAARASGLGHRIPQEFLDAMEEVLEDVTERSMRRL